MPVAAWFDDGTASADGDAIVDCEERRVQLKGLFEEGTYAGAVRWQMRTAMEPASGYNPSYTAMRAAEFYEKVANDSIPNRGIGAMMTKPTREWINCGRPWE